MRETSSSLEALDSLEAFFCIDRWQKLKEMVDGLPKPKVKVFKLREWLISTWKS